MTAQLVLPLYTGEYQRALDAKGRIALPVAWDLGPSVALFAASPGVLVTPADRWQLVLDNLDPLPLAVAASGSWTVDICNRERRVLIPWELRQHAGLRPRSEAVAVGIGPGVLLCRPGAWQGVLTAWERALVRMMGEGRARSVGAVGG